jgi:thioredoxin-related protein
LIKSNQFHQSTNKQSLRANLSMKKYILGILLATSVLTLAAQDLKKFNLYHPDANAKKELQDAITKAKQEKKHVFVQIGGNWCIWCARFHDFINSDAAVDSLIKADYIVYHLNYSKENKNTGLLTKYEFPQRFGFPVFLILDGNGRLLHTQNSGYLENGNKGYDREAVLGFLQDWRPAALDPKQYKDQ